MFDCLELQPHCGSLSVSCDWVWNKAVTYTGNSDPPPPPPRNRKKRFIQYKGPKRTETEMEMYSSVPHFYKQLIQHTQKALQLAVYLQNVTSKQEIISARSAFLKRYRSFSFIVFLSNFYKKDIKMLLHFWYSKNVPGITHYQYDISTT